MSECRGAEPWAIPVLKKDGRIVPAIALSTVLKSLPVTVHEAASFPIWGRTRGNGLQPSIGNHQPGYRGGSSDSVSIGGGTMPTVRSYSVFIYKTYLEIADRISDRRERAND